MAPPPESRARPKWLWVALIVIFAIILIAVLSNPSGDRDGTVEDPIVMPETGEGVGVGQNDDPEEASEGPAPEPFAPGGTPSE